MKRFLIFTALILTFSLLASLPVLSTAEIQQEDEWQADILKLMDEKYAPKATSIRYDHPIPESAVTDERTFFVERINGEGLTMRIDLAVTALSDYTDADWAEVDTWLKTVINQAIQGVEVDTEKMSSAVYKALNSAQKSAARDEDPSEALWKPDILKLTGIDVTIPYYPQLSEGINGSATQKLQEKLILMGYLEGAADGYYGAKTKAAVEQLERYIRELEQDVIDALPKAEPEATSEPPQIPLTEEENTEEKTEVVYVPEPATPVDGVADAMLQAYLCSPDFKVVRKNLENGDSGENVQRLQRRLIALGYLADTADGVYGGGTARAVRIFQYYHGLELDGKASTALQHLIFSHEAKAPENPILAEGSSGDAVKTLQKRLRVLGFMNGSADGDYGKATSNGVKVLQKYMRDMEESKIRSDAEVMARLEATGEDISALLTVEVNGIADPILLDEFYADAFPEVPAAMTNGAAGNDVVRIQRRLNGLEYYYGSLDGSYGNGTESAIRAFQKQNGLGQSGIAGEDTLKLLFSENAKKAVKPYVLKISTKDQRVYAYKPDKNGEYTVLARTMKCSTGKDVTPTPKGTFQNGTGPGARWHFFKKFNCWAQYAYYIDGDIMFHSVLYNQKDGPVTQSSVNNLGRKASHGCVRLSVEDAKWVYTNCPRNTKIIVY